MPLSWNETKPLVRLQGVAEELLASARGGKEAQDGAIQAQLNAVMQEVFALLTESDQNLADEFKRLVIGDAPDRKAIAEIRAATLVGWLRAALNAESLEARTSERVESDEPPRRKQTVGFKIRSPVVRETTSSARPKDSSG